MQPTEVADAARRLGIVPTGTASPIKPGLGGNELWRIAADDGDQVLRFFPPGAPSEIAEREAAAHNLASAHGVPTPRVTGLDRIGDRSMLAMDWIEGETVATALLAGRDPETLGRSSGELLARLHRIDAAPEVISNRNWIDWAGPRADRLRPLLAGSSTLRLLHLDAHPENLIMGPADSGGRLWVLDWANVRIGPPAADLARTLSIIDLVHDALPGITEQQRRTLMIFRDALLVGYSAAGGDPEVPQLIMAWAQAVQLVDLVDSWVPEWYFDRLREGYREAVENSP